MTGDSSGIHSSEYVVDEGLPREKKFPSPLGQNSRNLRKTVSVHIYKFQRYKQLLTCVEKICGAVTSWDG